MFKAPQTYSDGDVVRWIDEPTSGVELEHPAPVLKLTPGSGAHGGEVAAAEDGNNDGCWPGLRPSPDRR